MAQTDLHIHSSLTAGGELSPRALAERCCEEQLTLAALTDRRAVSGVPECIWRGAQLGVRILPGIELDCRRYAQDFLVLGLGIDITCPVLLDIERTRNDSALPMTVEQALGSIHTAGGLAVFVTGGSGFLRENLPPHRLGAVTFGGHETDIAAAVLAALTQSEKSKRSFYHDSI